MELITPSNDIIWSELMSASCHRWPTFLFVSHLFFADEQQLHQLLLPLGINHPSEENIGYGYTNSDKQDNQRCVDGIVHRHGDFAYNSMHIDEGKQGSVHQHSRNHRYDTGYAQALVGCVQATYHEAADDTNHCRPDKGAYNGAHIQSDVA